MSLNIEKEALNERTYLTLPKIQDAGLFQSVIAQLKQDGAKYDSDKKAWYMTSKNDRSKFAQYLPPEKTSVHNKLGNNKITLARKRQENKAIESQNKHDKERMA